MSWRNTLILLGVAVLVAVGIWLSDRQQERAHVAEERAKRLFPDLESGQLEWVAFSTSDGQNVRLVRKDGVWRVAEPVDFPADAPNADAIAGALATMSSEAVIEDPQPPEVYGLGEGVQVVRFSAGGREQELRIGKKAPVGNFRYVTTGPGADGKVYTVAGFKVASFEKPLDDLRERRPLRFEREQVRRIEAQWTGGGVVVEKQDGAWRLVEPITGEADGDAIDTLLADLAFLRADGFVDEPPPPAEVGLDEPQYRVVLVGAAEENQEPPRWELAIGGMIGSGVRAGKAAEPALYEIPDDRFQKLPKTVNAFRFKQLSRYVASDAERFELIFPDPESEGATRIVTITGERNDDGWETKPERMAAGSAARLVAELARLDAVDIAADEVGPQELVGLGLSPPQATIRVYGRSAPADEESEGESAPAADQLLAEVQFGAHQKGHILARRADRSTIFLVDDDRAEAIPVSLEAFRNRFVSKETPAEESGEGDDAGAEADADAAPESADDAGAEGAGAE